VVLLRKEGAAGIHERIKEMRLRYRTYRRPTLEYLQTKMEKEFFSNSIDLDSHVVLQLSQVRLVVHH